MKKELTFVVSTPLKEDKTYECLYFKDTEDNYYVIAIPFYDENGNYLKELSPLGTWVLNYYKKQNGNLSLHTEPSLIVSSNIVISADFSGKAFQLPLWMEHESQLARNVDGNYGSDKIIKNAVLIDS